MPQTTLLYSIIPKFITNCKIFDRFVAKQSDFVLFVIWCTKYLIDCTISARNVSLPLNFVAFIWE